MLVEQTVKSQKTNKTMHYLPVTDEEQKKMLQEIGVKSFEDLLKGIPAALRDPKIDVQDTLSELEVQNLIASLGKKNQTIKESLSFLGGGSYEHFIPQAVGSITGRHEFYTAYTPYQPEASQGTLQSIYEYQSLITELTGLDVSNASHYDGSTSMAEAALLALKQTDRTIVLVSRAVHPHYRQVLETYFKGTPYKLQEVGFAEDGSLNREELSIKLNEDVACFIVQSPNFFGLVEDLEGVSEELKQIGALFVMSSHPLALGTYKSPGEWGADVAVGEGQPLGIAPQFGGPYVGYFSTSRALMRRIPGRLAGITEDLEGKRAYCLTLQAREQHIRRERAASNICTNQALCALAACVYMTLLGKEGIREIGEINLDRAYYLRQSLAKLDGFEVNLEQPIFNEFVVRTEKSFDSIQAKLQKANIFPGIDLGKFYSEFKNSFLVCATETKTQADLDRFTAELSKC